MLPSYWIKFHPVSKVWTFLCQSKGHTESLWSW